MVMLSRKAMMATGVFDANTVDNLSHWYKANDLTTLYQDSSKTTSVSSDGDPVGAWVDQIVSADEVAQATTSSKPTYRSSVSAFNSKPALQFDGGDNLQGAFSSTISQPITHFVVAQWTVSATGVAYDGDDGTHRNALYQIAGPKWRMNGGSVVDTGNVGDTSVHIFCAVFNSASSGLWVDGVSQSSGDAGTQTLDGLTIGSNYVPGNYFTGYFAEHLIYGASLTNSQRNTVQNYLASKYNINVTQFS